MSRMSKKKTPKQTSIPLGALLDRDGELARHLKAEHRFAENNPKLYGALLDMMSDGAAHGRKFITGRKSGTVSPIRKAIQKALKANPTLKNAQLWMQIGKAPPKGYTFQDNRIGKYIEGQSAGSNMGYDRFCNVAAEERKALKE